MNKRTIITNSRAWLAYPLPFLLALVIVADTSDAFNFRIDHEDVAVAVNKDIAGNQVPDDKGTVGIATNSILMVEAKGCHIRVDGYLWRRFGILYEILLHNRHNGPAVETRKGMESIVSVRDISLCILTLSKSRRILPLFKRLLTL